MRKMHFQSIKPAVNHTINARNNKGVDVYLSVDGGVRCVRRVSENAVRCIIGTGYDYFLNRDIKKSGLDISCPCSESDLTTLKNSIA